MGVDALTPLAPTDITLSASAVDDGAGAVVGTLRAVDGNAPLGDLSTFAFADAAGGLSAAQAAALFEIVVLPNGLSELRTRLADSAARIEGGVSLALAATDMAGLSVTRTLSLTAGTTDRAITGTDADDLIQGGAGDDTILGGAGEDTLIGGLGNDRLDGGAGEADVARYNVDWSAVTILRSGEDTILTTLEGSDTLSGVEFVEFRSARLSIDALRGTPASDVTLGDSVVPGMASDGTRIGLLQVTDADLARGDVQSFAFADAVGGLSAAEAAAQFGFQTDGVDTWLVAKGGVDYAAGPDSLLIAVTATGLDGLSASFDLGLTVTPEGLVTGTAGADVLRAGSGPTELRGLDGDDLLIGGAGADTLQGGAGDDSLTGAGGDDTLIGGSGSGDVAFFAEGWDDVTVVAEGGGFRVTGASGSDLLTGVELFDLNGARGAVADAISASPQSIRLSTHNVLQTLGMGDVAAVIHAYDPNTAFGDTVSLRIVDAPGGLTATEAAALFTIEGGSLLRAGDLLSHGLAFTFAIEATDAAGHSLIQSFDMAVDRVNQHIPVAVGDDFTGAPVSESTTAQFDLIGNDTDGDAKAPLRISQQDGARVQVVQFGNFTPLGDPQELLNLGTVQVTRAALFAALEAGISTQGGTLVVTLPDLVTEASFASGGTYLSSLPLAEARQILSDMVLTVSYYAEDSFGALSGQQFEQLKFTAEDQAATGTTGSEWIALDTPGIYAGSGAADTVLGSDGHDLLHQISGAATVDAGAGNDILNWSTSGDYTGGAGDDTIRYVDVTDGATALIDGGTGNDEITIFDIGAGHVTLTGGAGNDTFIVFDSLGNFGDAPSGHVIAYEGVTFAEMQINASNPQAVTITDLRDASVPGHFGSDTLMLLSGQPFQNVMVEIGGVLGALLDAVTQAPSDLTLSVDSFTETRALGDLIATLTPVDANSAFGDTVSLRIVDRAGGLSAAEAASLVTLDGFDLRTAGTNLRMYGDTLDLAFEATDSTGQSTVFERSIVITAANLHAPVAGGGRVTGGEGDTLRIDLLTGASDADPLDVVSVLNLPQGAAGALTLDAVTLQAPYARIDVLAGGTVEVAGVTYDLSELAQALSDALFDAGTGLARLDGSTLSLSLPQVWQDLLMTSDGEGGFDRLGVTIGYSVVDQDGRVSANRGAAQVNFDGADTVLTGTSGAETLTLSAPGTILGGGGADLLIGSDGHDRLELGDGVGTVQGGSEDGAGTVRGGAGDDLLIGTGSGTADYGDLTVADVQVTHAHTDVYWVDSAQGADTLEGLDQITLDGASYALADHLPQTAAIGTVWASLSASDINPGESFAYRFVDAAGGLSAAQAAELFTIQGDKLRVAGSDLLAYGPAPQIAIEVTDSAGLTHTQTFDLSIDRVNLGRPVVNGTDRVLSVDEDATLRFNVFDYVTDPNSFDPLTLHVDGIFAPQLDIYASDYQWRVSDPVSSVQADIAASLTMTEDGWVEMTLPDYLPDVMIEWDGALFDMSDYTSFFTAVWLELRVAVTDTLSPEGDFPTFVPFEIYFNGSDDTVTGTTGADTITLTSGTVVQGLGGDDTVTGSLLRDVIVLGDGDAVVSAGAGNDTVVLGAGAALIDAGAGDDTIIMTGSGAATIQGGAGNDLIEAQGSGAIARFDGVLWSDLAFSTTDSGALVVTDMRDASIAGHLGSNTLSGVNALEVGDQRVATAALTPQAAQLTLVDQALMGRGLVAGSIVARIAAEDGNAPFGDTQSYAFADLDGGLSAEFAAQVFGLVTTDTGVEVELLLPRALPRSGDILFAITATGSDGLSTHLELSYALAPDRMIVGLEEADRMRGTGAADSVVGPDTVNGGEGVDRAVYRGSDAGVTVDLSLGEGQGGDTAGDVLTGIERVVGSEFADTLRGDAGDNLLSGNAGADSLWGGAGRDVLSGGDGADTLIGGAGDDRLFGGADADRFVFAQGSGHDLILDFGAEDEIAVDTALWQSIGAPEITAFLTNNAVETGGAVEIRFSETDSVRVVDVTLAHMLTQADQFVFV
ncbi:Hemolysin-type calcium-binding repeat-containing protein [Tropicibacter naphthalenivorans]|uniref:Cyclolysin n=2 Tax=Tropicibacter naphthalenivorans TaxID=441103 RepID=A0A0P1GF44_9RHOB|nr:Cyclolysin [Tropicibacter naphthalenivorans]SMC84255.1 Hemolysin-type calcium-binding repeat-containing protein [Tropicibacter naphthalenivorans]